MKKIAALDYGTVRIGIALSDERQIVALPTACIPTAKTIDKTAQNLCDILSQMGNLEKVVIGLPLHLSGKDSKMSLEVRQLATKLEELLQLPIILFDERLTTALVERALKEGEMSRKKRKNLVDALAATVILQNYLDSQSF